MSSTRYLKPAIAAHVALLLLCIIAAKPVLANTQAMDCKAEYSALSKEHADTIAQTKTGTPPYFNALHAIENKIFTAFQHCPKDPLLFTLMGEVQISLGNLQLAGIYAKKAFNWDQDVWQTHHLLGTTLAMQEDYATGLKHLEKAAEIGNDRPELVFNLCSTYLAAKEYKNAIETCTEVIQRNDHQLHGPTFHIRGQAYEALKMVEKANRDYKNARLLDYK